MRNLKHIRYRYGLTEEQYQELYESQNGLCAACNQPPRARGVGHSVLCIDHNHYTDEVRGLLCQGCNAAVGLAQDSPRVLRALASYLERPPAIDPKDIIPKDRGRRMRDRTHCNNGHEYTAENTRYRQRVSRVNPTRECIQCAKIWESHRTPRKSISASATGNARITELS